MGASFLYYYTVLVGDYVRVQQRDNKKSAKKEKKKKKGEKTTENETKLFASDSYIVCVDGAVRTRYFVFVGGGGDAPIS